MHDPRLTAARVARLATTDSDGRPHLVPIVFALEGDTRYSAVDRKPKHSSKLRRIENARARPEVTDAREWSVDVEKVGVCAHAV